MLKKTWSVNEYILFVLLLFLSAVCLFIYFNQNGNNLTEDQLLSRMFKCPEYYSSEKEKDDATMGFVNYYYYNYPGITEEEFFKYRFDFLEKNNCIEALQIWAENYRAEEEYWAEVERQDAIKSVIGTSTNKIPR